MPSNANQSLNFVGLGVGLNRICTAGKYGGERNAKMILFSEFY